MPTRDRYWKDPEKWRAQTREYQYPSYYACWSGMIQRCTNPNNRDFASYGGRGIKVCRRWRESFSAFALDMGDRPSPKHTIERKRNNGNYTKSNCEWAERKKQSRNTRTNHFISMGGRRQCVSAWAEELDIDRQTIYTRLSRGWSPIAALTTPARAYGG